MKKLFLFPLLTAFVSFAFMEKEKQVETPPPVLFAVLNDGQYIEAIATLEDGKLVQAIGGDETSTPASFSAKYYKTGDIYRLIYGGKDNGKVTVVSSNAETECAATTANVKISSSTLRLKRFEMALATNISTTKPASGVRKAPTAAEKIVMDKLVIKEFQKNKIPVKGLKAVKLTVIDADNNKVNEIVGTYTVSPNSTERGLLFFIATKTKTGYTINYSECRRIKKDEVMSGEIVDVDGGIYQEMLLDLLDTDNDGRAELFTVTQSFEGIGFQSYQWDGKAWTRGLEVSNYHCGY